MSSKIEVQRICQHCGKDFTARTTVTRFCTHRCASAANKQRIRAGKVEQSNKETQKTKNQPIEDLKAKEFLTVREVAQLLNCSVRSAYYYIGKGNINAVNLGQRITRVKRSNIDKLFEQPRTVTPKPESKTEQIQFSIADCYSLSEARDKYGISRSTLQALIKRNSIPTIKKGWYAYVPKPIIDKHLG